MRQGRLLIGVATIALVLAGLPGVAGAAGSLYVSVGDASVVEPSNRNGTVAVEVPITVHGGFGTPITIDWRVNGGAATPDLVTTSGTLVTQAGAAGGAIVIDVRADRTTEPEETFAVELVSVSGAEVADAIGVLTIRPPAAGLSVGDIALTEPDVGRLGVAIPVTLGGPPNKVVTFGWQLRSGTGTVGSDALAASGTGTIAKGVMGTLVRAEVTGDTVVEPDETLELVVTSVSNTSLADGLGIITLRNTDVAPTPTPTATTVPPTPTPTPTAQPTPVPTPVPTPTSPPGPFDWQPPVGSVPATGTAIYIESSAGDWVGQGGTYRYTQADAVLGVTTFENYVRVVINGDEGWDANFDQGDAGSTVQTGAWDGVGRYPMHRPGLSFTGEGRGCNESLGRFVVDRVSYLGGELATLTLRFEQRCEITGPPLRGFIRYEASDPTEPPPPGDASDLPWSPPAGAVPATGDYFYFESTSGDYIGQGRTELYTPPTSTLTPDWFSNRFQFFVNRSTPSSNWSLRFAGRWNQPQLAEGLYDGLQGYGQHNPAKGGLEMSGEGRGCGSLTGAFAIDEITYDGAQLQSISLRFVQRCAGTHPPLHGALRWTAP